MGGGPYPPCRGQADEHEVEAHENDRILLAHADHQHSGRVVLEVKELHLRGRQTKVQVRVEESRVHEACMVRVRVRG